MNKVMCAYCGEQMELVRSDDNYHFYKCEGEHNEGVGRVDHVVEKVEEHDIEES